MPLDENLQVVNWPTEDGIYPIVQLDINGKPYIRFPVSTSCISHGGILMELLDIYDRESMTFVARNGQRLPALEGEGYKVMGAGKASVEVGQKTAVFFDRSISYEIGIDRKHLEGVRELIPDWKIG